MNTSTRRRVSLLLAEAVHSDNVAAVKRITNQTAMGWQVDLDIRTSWQCTPFLIAVEKGNEQVSAVWCVVSMKEISHSGPVPRWCLYSLLPRRIQP